MTAFHTPIVSIGENPMKSKTGHLLTRYTCACCLNSFDAATSDYLKPNCPYCRNNRAVGVAMSGRTLLLIFAALIVLVLGMGLWSLRSVPEHSTPPIAEPAPHATSR